MGNSNTHWLNYLYSNEYIKTISIDIEVQIFTGTHHTYVEIEG